MAIVKISKQLLESFKEEDWNELFDNLQGFKKISEDINNMNTIFYADINGFGKDEECIITVRSDTGSIKIISFDHIKTTSYNSKTYWSL